ncbi:MAG: A24 family peptidase [Deltaproteobacteria bacterium]
MEPLTRSPILFAGFLFAIGACLGSFFNVLIHRLPLGESIVRPGSRCPSCGRPIRPRENIPILSFFLLRGRCAGCGARISRRYPFVEALSGAGFAFFAYVDGPGFPLVRDLLLFSLVVPITFIDFDHRIIPDELSLGGVAAGLVLSVLPGGDWKGSLLGVLLGGGILYATAWTYEKAAGREGMGGGDIKLIALIGAFLGWKGALFSIFAGSLLGVGAGVIAMRKGEEGLKTAIPFGPCLCAAALLSRFLAEPFFRRLAGF